MAGGGHERCLTARAERKRHGSHSKRLLQGLRYEGEALTRAAPATPAPADEEEESNIAVKSKRRRKGLSDQYQSHFGKAIALTPMTLSFCA